MEKLIIDKKENIEGKVNAWTDSSLGYYVKSIQELKDGYIAVVITNKNK